MLSSFLILLYASIFLWLLIRITRTDRPFLSQRMVAASFAVKILFGMLYGYMFMRFYHGDDTWQYHRDSLIEYQKLLHHPLLFLKETFTATGGRMSLEAAYNTTNSFWSEFEEVLFIRLLVLFNVFSFGQYYVNVVFFCFLGWMGQLLLFRLFTRCNKDSILPLYVIIFFYPAVLFWLSGIRKEGLLMVGMAAALYYFNKLMQHSGNRIKNVVFLSLSLLMLGLVRNLVLLCMLPALAGWLIYNVTRIPKAVAYGGVYLLSSLLFFSGNLLPGLPDFAWKVTERQYTFLALNGKTRLALDSLHGDVRSFVRVLPQALNHTFVQPKLTGSRSPLQLLSALDIFLFFLCAGMAIFFRKPQWRRVLFSPLLLTSIFIAFTGYLIIGYIVPFPGALVRYKSLFQLLFLACFMSLTAIQRPYRLE